MTSSISSIGDLIAQGLAQIQTGPFGSQLHSYDYVPSGVPVVPTEAIRERRIDREVCPQITPDKAAELSRHRLLPGDILFARRGVQATGHIGVVREAEEGFICGTGAIRLRISEGNDVVCGEYLSHLLADPASIAWFKFHAIGATMPNLNEGIICSFPVMLPSYYDQRTIAAFLSDLDDKIELNRKTAATLEEMARVLYRSWFVDFDPVWAKTEGRAPAHMDAETAALFPDGFDDEGLPLGWRMVTVSDLYDVTMGQSPPGETYNDSGEGLPFFQGCTDFGPRYPTNRKFCSAPSRIAEAESTLLSVRAPVGELNKARERCCIGRGVGSVREKQRRHALGFYAMDSLAEAFEAYQSEGTVFGSINKKQLEGLAIVAGPDTVRDKFESIAGPIDAKIRNLTLENDTLATLRDTLLPKLMSGELRVGEARELVEEAA